MSTISPVDLKKSVPRMGVPTAANKNACLVLKSPFETSIFVQPNVCTGWAPMPKIVSTLSMWSGGLKECGSTETEAPVSTRNADWCFLSCTRYRRFTSLLPGSLYDGKHCRFPSKHIWQIRMAFRNFGLLARTELDCDTMGVSVVVFSVQFWVYFYTICWFPLHRQKVGPVL